MFTKATCMAISERRPKMKYMYDKSVLGSSPFVFFFQLKRLNYPLLSLNRGSALTSNNLFRWRVVERCMILMLLICGVHLWLSMRESSVSSYRKVSYLILNTNTNVSLHSRRKFWCLVGWSRSKIAHNLCGGPKNTGKFHHCRWRTTEGLSIQSKNSFCCFFFAKNHPHVKTLFAKHKLYAEKDTKKAALFFSLILIFVWFSLQLRVDGYLRLQFPDEEQLEETHIRHSRFLPNEKKYRYSPTRWLQDLEIVEDGLADNITLVTAYINIGSFVNDNYRVRYEPAMYHKWMTVFSRIENPVVAYMTDDTDIDIFKSIRANISSAPTEIIKISTDALWAFLLKDDIQQIFDDPAYPKHSPNTFSADYVSVMHSK